MESLDRHMISMCYNEYCPQAGKNPKLFLCSRCKSARFCSKDCQLASIKDHGKSCIDPGTIAFNLMKTVYADDFNAMNEELEASYGFEKCKTPQEKQNLLGLYQGLIKCLECDIKDLDRAFRENKIPEFIVSAFFYSSGPKSCGEYFKWFIKDFERCRH